MTILTTVQESLEQQARAKIEPAGTAIRAPPMYVIRCDGHRRFDSGTHRWRMEWTEVSSISQTQGG